MSSQASSTPLALPYYQYVKLDGDSLFNAKIFVGVANTDPTNPANQIDVLAIQAGGGSSVVDQPIRTNSAGHAVDDVGNVIYPVVGSQYSITVTDQNDSLLYEESCINPFGADFNTEIKQFKPVITLGLTFFAVPDAPSTINLIINGDVQELKEDESDVGSYTYSGGIVTLVDYAFIGDETVVVQFGFVVPKTTIRPDGFISFASVAQMVLDEGLEVDERIVTYMFKKKVTSFWEIVSTGAGDMSDGTLSLNNGLFARIQILPEMLFRAFGAFGGGANDDSDAIINTIKNSPKSVGHPDDFHFVTKHLDASISNRLVQGRGATILWNGVADPITIVGRDQGIFNIKGTLGPVLDQSGVQAQWLRGSEIYPTTDSSLIVNEKFLVVTAGVVPAANVGYLLRPKVSPSNPATRIQLDYILDWDLFNVQWTYKKVTVVENVIIEGFKIIDQTDPDGSSSTVSGVVMQFAVNCHSNNNETTNVYFPSLFGYFTTDCTINGCRVNPSTNTEPSGFGAAAQWNNAYRTTVDRVNAQGVRRDVDFTACSFFTVRDCGDNNTRDGGFTTHGQYEANGTYINNLGDMSFANSGPLFGETCRNMTVINQRGSRINASNNVINSSFKDCECFFYNLNTVKLTVDNCNTFTDQITPANFQLNNWSRRLGFTPEFTSPAFISNSKIGASSPGFLVDQDISAEDSVHFNDCEIDLQQGDFAGPANIKMDKCELTGNTLVLIANPTKIELINCDMFNVAWGVLDDLSLVTGGVDFRVSGGTITGDDTFGSAMFAMRDESQLGIECKMFFDNVVINWDFPTIFESPLGTRNPEWNNEVVSCKITNTGVGAGTIRISNQQSPMRFQNNTIKDVTLDLDAPSATRIIENTIVDT